MIEDPRFKKGLELFNDKQYHEAHDIWEELWTEKEADPDRSFLQGLIQISVSHYLYGEERLPGAKKVYLRAVKNLENYNSPHLEIDFENLLVGLAGLLR